MSEALQLEQFTGTFHHYKGHMGVIYTDGVMYLCGTGAAWAVSDAAVICKMKLSNFEFIAIDVKVDLKRETCTIYYTDGNGRELYKQRYRWTDLKQDIKLYYVDNVLMLASEY